MKNDPPRLIVPKNIRPDGCGFSLLEIVLVLFILGLLATALAPSVRDIVDRGRIEAESRTLDDLVATITRSFESTDLAQLNVAALPGTLPSGDAPTTFAAATGLGYSTTLSTSWFTKVARLRGLTPQLGVAPTAALQPEVAKLVTNGFGQPRLLFAGDPESGRARFLLVSLAAPSTQLVLPPFEPGAVWFDALWNHDWESRTAALPAAWISRLTSAQVAGWTQGQAGTTQVHRLMVRRIVLPTFTVTINNNHPTDHAYVAFGTDTLFTSPANSGANATPEILGGRLITIHRGPASPGVEVLRFHLHENATVTLQ